MKSTLVKMINKKVGSQTFIEDKCLSIDGGKFYNLKIILLMEYTFSSKKHEDSIAMSIKHYVAIENS